MKITCFIPLCFLWPLGHLCRLVSELRCRQSSANEERLVRLQTVLKPMSLGGMDDGLHRRTVGLKFEDYLMVILFVLLVVQYPFWWCKNTKKKHDMIDKEMLDAFLYGRTGLMRLMCFTKSAPSWQVHNPCLRDAPCGVVDCGTGPVDEPAPWT